MRSTSSDYVYIRRLLERLISPRIAATIPELNDHPATMGGKVHNCDIMDSFGEFTFEILEMAILGTDAATLISHRLSKPRMVGTYHTISEGTKRWAANRPWTKSMACVGL